MNDSKQPGVCGKQTSYPITDKQIKAIKATENLVIIEGLPGSGKTAILCSHIRWITSGRTETLKAKPQQIIAVAYTKRAGTEMRTRLHKADPSVGWNTAFGGEKPFIGTHHKFLMNLVFSFKTFVGYPGQIKELKYLTDNAVENAQNSCSTHVKNVMGMTGDIATKLIQKRFESLLKTRGECYYTQLKHDALAIINNKECKEQIKEQNKILIVDEAQDIGEEESKIYMDYPAIHKYFVGDRAQAIFQEPNHSLLETANKDINATKICLNENFRSLPSICEAAHQMLKHHRPDLEQIPPIPIREEPTNKNVVGVITWLCESEEDQMKEMVRLTKHYAESRPGVYQFDDIAIIYKENFQSKQITQALTSAGIRYREENGEDLNTQGNIENLVHLVKVHQAKGQSYTNVILPFCTARFWPGKEEPNKMRRLLYVAMSRAENTIHFLYQQQTAWEAAELAGKPIEGRETRLIERISPYIEEMNNPHLTVSWERSQKMTPSTDY